MSHANGVTDNLPPLPARGPTTGPGCFVSEGESKTTKEQLRSMETLEVADLSSVRSYVSMVLEQTGASVQTQEERHRRIDAWEKERAEKKASPAASAPGVHFPGGVLPR